MRTRTFTELEEAYNETFSGLDPDDIIQRNFLLNQYASSVIVEGEWFELENLEKWNNENINEIPIHQIWYGKIDYDFGLVEYFLRIKTMLKSLSLLFREFILHIAILIHPS